jgi:hypothetical protein
MVNALRRLVTVAVLVVLVVPVLRNGDSFPLSTYPMYAFERPTVVSFPTAVGIEIGGASRRLDLDTIGESDDPLIVASVVRQAIRAGDEAVLRLCHDIAARAAALGLDLVEIDVVTERHNVVDRARDEPSLISSDLHASCPVERSS